MKDQANYKNIFATCNPIDGLVSGDAAKNVLLKSRLPVDVLGNIWTLSDVDNDGYLDVDEVSNERGLGSTSYYEACAPTVLYVSAFDCSLNDTFLHLEHSIRSFAWPCISATRHWVDRNCPSSFQSCSYLRRSGGWTRERQPPPLAEAQMVWVMRETIKMWGNKPVATNVEEMEVLVCTTVYVAAKALVT